MSVNPTRVNARDCYARFPPKPKTRGWNLSDRRPVTTALNINCPDGTSTRSLLITIRRPSLAGSVKGTNTFGRYPAKIAKYEALTREPTPPSGHVSSRKRSPPFGRYRATVGHTPRFRDGFSTTRRRRENRRTDPFCFIIHPPVDSVRVVVTDVR